MENKIHHNLPFEMNSTANFKVFKNKLKSYLFQNCFFILYKSWFSNDDKWLCVDCVMNCYLHKMCFT